MAWQVWVLAAQIIFGGVLVTVGARLAAHRLLAKGTVPAPPMVVCLGMIVLGGVMLASWETTLGWLPAR